MKKGRSREGCCIFRRGKTDTLRDEDDGKYYCGTCWQRWLQRNARPLKDNASISKNVGGKSTDPDQRQTQTSGGDVVEGKGEVAEGSLHLDEGDASAPCFPFQIQNDRDHCETPLEAYEDLDPLLKWLAAKLGKSKSELQIYDPYYCSGAVVRRLKKLGYKNVHNKCQDFYSVIEEKCVPTYDVIVVNPPYSTSPIDHIERLTTFLVSQSKPWFVLQPNYVYTKPFWENLSSQLSPRPFFLTPPTPRSYIYDTPGMFKSIKSKQRKTSPFVTMWYCHTGKHTAAFYRWWAAKGAKQCYRLSLACTEYFIANNFKDSSDRTRRKPRKRKRTEEESEEKRLKRSKHV